MALLIDGYNLLHVTGIVGRGPAAGTLQASREALIGFLAESIEPPLRPQTTIVFDAAEAPPGLPRVVRHDGMVVRYASGYPDADTLIEELIEAHEFPRRLMVVSSDHRIQRAARRRRAKWQDSDVWYRRLWETRHQRLGGGPTLPEKPSGPLSPAETRRWVEIFDDPKITEPTASDPRESKPPTSNPQPNKPLDDADEIFPPGYGSDIDEDSL